MRARLYPRAIDVLRRLDAPGMLLTFNRADRKYRINDGEQRVDRLHGRTVDAMLRCHVVRVTQDGAMVITQHGRAVVRRYAGVVVSTKFRRLMMAGVKRFEMVIPVEAVVFDGENIDDVDALLGAKNYGLSWNRDDKRVDVILPPSVTHRPGRLVPNEDVLIRHADGNFAVAGASEFAKNYREARA